MDFFKYEKEIEKTIGYVFRDKSLLRQAFTRTSFCNENSSKRNEYHSNEVLEFFGDSVLSCAIITLLMAEHTERYENGIKTKLTEGDFSNIKSSLSDKKNLSRATRALGLQKYLIMGEGDKKLGIENEPSVMEDLFESIIGAVYIDSSEDFSKVLSVCKKMLNVSDYFKGAPKQSAKNVLQEFCQNKEARLPAPVYKTISESGPDHKKSFERACFIGEKIYGVGVGKNQKIADALAAEAALVAITREFEEKKNPKIDPKLVTEKLRAIAKQNKKPTPEFRDLGEEDGNFLVECRFMEKSVIGKGVGKRDAKESAASKMLKLLSCEKGEKAQGKTAPPNVKAKRKYKKK